MTDIVERLKRGGVAAAIYWPSTSAIAFEAADEIDRLRKFLSDTNTYYAECIAEREELRDTVIALQAQLLSTDELKNTNNKWKHVKTGGIYEVVGECLIQATNTLAVLYRSTVAKDAYVWARPYSEFHDGRFVKVETVADD